MTVLEAGSLTPADHRLKRKILAFSFLHIQKKIHASSITVISGKIPTLPGYPMNPKPLFT